MVLDRLPPSLPPSPKLRQTSKLRRDKEACPTKSTGAPRRTGFRAPLIIVLFSFYSVVSVSSVVKNIMKLTTELTESTEEKWRI